MPVGLPLLKPRCAGKCALAADSCMCVTLCDSGRVCQAAGHQCSLDNLACSQGAPVPLAVALLVWESPGKHAPPDIMAAAATLFDHLMLCRLAVCGCCSEPAPRHHQRNCSRQHSSSRRAADPWRHHCCRVAQAGVSGHTWTHKWLHELLPARRRRQSGHGVHR
jgi:hypothetical protein